jgi:Ser/Thr protein kinase RdoA (MazF antagonist)
LARYDIDVARFAVQARSFNTIVRLDARDGRRLALRVGTTERIHPVGNELVEAAWLKLIRDEGIVAVPTVVGDRDGRPAVTVRLDGERGTRDCMLFGWVDGRQLGLDLRPRDVRASGRILALLHEQAAGGSYAPPAIVADRVLYFTSPRFLDDLEPRYGRLFADAEAGSQAAIDALWASPPHAPHLLHGDFTQLNLLANRGRLTVIDFQDLIWGFEVQDVAIALYGYSWMAAGGAHAEAFRAGYEEARAWPVDDPAVVDALWAARQLLQVNLALTLRRSGFESYVQSHVDRLRAWLSPAG